MKSIYKNITPLLLIFIALTLTQCHEVTKSCCEEILDFSYTNNDSLIEFNLSEAKKCAEKYHKRPEFLQKISQIYYFDATNDYSSEQLISASKKLFLALDYINLYFSTKDILKSYDYQYRGEIYERLGDIYKDINSLKSSAELYDKALSDYKSANNEEKTLNILLKIGKLYQKNHIHDIAMIYFEMAEEKVTNNQNIHRKIIDNKIVTLYELNDYNKADSLFLNHFNIKIQDYDYHSALGTKLFYERNYEKALPHLIYCFENGDQQEKISASEKLAEAYFNLGDSEKEIFHIQYQAKNNSNEIRRTPLKLDLEKLFDTHNTKNLSDNTIEKRTPNYILILVFVTLIAIVITIFIIREINRKKKINNIVKKDTGVVTTTSDKIINQQYKNKKNYDEAYKAFTESRIYTLIKSSFDGLNILTKNVQDYNKLKLSNKDLIQIIKTFNICFPNAVASLKKDFYGITISDIRFIVLCFMDLNNVEIAVLLGLTYGATNKKSNKIKNIFNTKEDLHTFLTNYIQSKY